MPATVPRIRPWLVATALLAWMVALAVNRSLRRVTGPSMEPTLTAGELVLVAPVVRFPPARGRLVVVRDPRAPWRPTVKRVVGLPGETVEVRGGVVLADGAVVVSASAHPDDDRDVLDDLRPVPPGHVYVLGDNRAASTDSRVFGPVPQEQVDRVVIARVPCLRGGRPGSCRWRRSAPAPRGRG